MAKPSQRTISYDAWAVTAPGLEALVTAELKTLGFADAAPATGGVSFSCDAHGLARAQLWLRIASRVIVRLAEFRATAFHELERAARQVEWARVLTKGSAVRLRVTCRKSRLYHSDAVAQRVAEAIARAVPGVTFADAGVNEDLDLTLPADDGTEPGRASDTDAQLFVVRLDRDRVTISADASGALLHRRGYRLAVARAPLRETLAAAMLAGAQWDPRTPLLDPMCGSGTIAIEAAMLARRMAPGAHRAFAAERWPEVTARAFADARGAASEQVLADAPAPIVASDRDAGAVTAARANAARAGVGADIMIEQRALSALDVPPGRGLLVANPPYGIRVGEKAPLRDLFASIGHVARARCPGWQVALLSADPQLDAQTKFRFDERFRTSNGGIVVRLVSAMVPARGT